MEAKNRELQLSLDKALKLAEKCKLEVKQEKTTAKTSCLEGDEQRVKICELQSKNSTYYNEMVEQKAISKLQEEQLTLLKEEVRNLKRSSHSSQELELKVRDLE